MILAIMQPYFMPYIGYFQLIEAADLFIVYDNIQYTKKGWINRNRMLHNGKVVTFSLPLKKGSDYLDVCERELAVDFNRDKLLAKIKGAYGRAPYFAKTFPLVEQIIRYEDTNLFRFLHNSILMTCEHLGIKTDIRVSSDINIDHDLKKQDKVLALCKAVGAGTYVNLSGGIDLYSIDTFREYGADLKLFESTPFEYPQLDNAFVPWLSIIDVMMFNALDTMKKSLLPNYKLTEPCSSGKN